MLYASKALIIISLGGEQLLVVSCAEDDLIIYGECFWPANKRKKNKIEGKNSLKKKKSLQYKGMKRPCLAKVFISKNKVFKTFALEISALLSSFIFQTSE